MKLILLIFSFAEIIHASTVVNEVIKEDFVSENLDNVTTIANVPEKNFIKEDLEKTEIALKHFISFLKREYADVEGRFENFIDKIESSEFFTNKFVIIRKIVNDLEDTYSIVKQDVLKIKDEIQQKARSVAS
ncbi:unnamed protein product, partial [Oikopleura dioica]